jgi:tail tube GTA-gp10-like protein
MANKYRGEVDIHLAGNKYLMRPTLGALCEIEDALGKSIITLLDQFSSKGLTLNEQAHIIVEGVKATGEALKYQVVLQDIGSYPTKVPNAT